jgi:hypothetical protein
VAVKNISLVILLGLLLSFELNAQIPQGFKLLELPQSPKVTQQIESSHPGWAIASEDTKHILKDITVYDGNPIELASLIPDKSIRNKKEMYSVWFIAKESKHRVWIKCEFSGTTITLSQALPSDTKVIRIYYNRQIMIEGNYRIEKILYK